MFGGYQGGLYPSWDGRGRHQQGAKTGLRRTVDVSTCYTLHLSNRLYWGNTPGFAMQPHSSYARKLLPPSAMTDNPSTSICTNFIKASVNKQRSPVNVVSWAPEGTTRCITGNSSGEFTLWKDGAFNFERIMQV
jgi:polyadenylation factor subunit 2